MWFLETPSAKTNYQIGFRRKKKRNATDCLAQVEIDIGNAVFRRDTL